MTARHPPDPVDERTLYQAIWNKGLEVARKLTKDPDERQELASKAQRDFFFRRLEDPTFRTTPSQRDAFVTDLVVKAAISIGRHLGVRAKYAVEITEGIVGRRRIEGNPEAEEELSRLRGLLFAAILTLSPRLETIVYLRYFEDWTPEKIATELRTTPGSVSAQLTKAKLLLSEDAELHKFFQLWEPGT